MNNFDMEHITTDGRSVKRHTRPPTKHFERILEEACPNHMYLIKHKLKDCGMMKDFMVSGSLTRGMEPEEDPGGRDVMSFPGEDAVVMVYIGHPPPGRCRMSNLIPGTPTHCSWEPEDTWV
jgi:hypothetical protein